MMEKKSIDQQRKISREGNLNPMFGKRHSYATKQKMSQAQKKRYAATRKYNAESMVKNLVESAYIQGIINKVVNETISAFIERDTLSK